MSCPPGDWNQPPPPRPLPVGLSDVSLPRVSLPPISSNTMSRRRVFILLTRIVKSRRASRAPPDVSPYAPHYLRNTALQGPEYCRPRVSGRHRSYRACCASLVGDVICRWSVMSYSISCCWVRRERLIIKCGHVTVTVLDGTNYHPNTLDKSLEGNLDTGSEHRWKAFVR